MSSIINSTTTSPGGLISTGDSSNSLLIQTGDTTAITINSTQQVALTNPLGTASGGTGSNSTTFCNLTSNVTGTLPVANGGTGNTSGAAASVATTNWTISESGGKLYFAYGGVNKFSLDSSGNFIAVANVTAYGTP